MDSDWLRNKDNRTAFWGAELIFPYFLVIILAINITPLPAVCAVMGVGCVTRDTARYNDQT